MKDIVIVSYDGRVDERGVGMKTLIRLKKDYTSWLNT